MGQYGRPRKIHARSRIAGTRRSGQAQPHRVMEGCGSRSSLGMALPMLAEATVLTARVLCRMGAASLLALAMLAGCSRDPVNSPYAQGGETENVLYTAFTQRSPKYLDPASSYSGDETPFTYSIYEPLYGYHYLARPYRLIPRAAPSRDPPLYFDSNGRQLPDDVAGEHVAYRVSDPRLPPGHESQPHPPLALDGGGKHAYWPMSAEQLKGKFDVTHFEQTGTRELQAGDYVYAFKRLASPRVVSPIYGIMAEHVVGMKEFGD